MVIMVPSGSQAVFSSALVPGFMGRSASTDTWIIIWTIARATTGLFPHEVNTQRNTAQNFTAARCMTRTVTRRHGDIDNGSQYEGTDSLYGRGSVALFYFRARAIQMFPVVSAKLNSKPSLVTDNPTLPGLPKLVKDCCE
jgi:hypothetical protein